jgi:hypothetical protein
MNGDLHPITNSIKVILSPIIGAISKTIFEIGDFLLNSIIERNNYTLYLTYYVLEFSSFQIHTQMIDRFSGKSYENFIFRSR